MNKVLICGNSNLRNQTNVRKQILDFYFETKGDVWMINNAYKEHMIFTHLIIDSAKNLQEIIEHRKKILWDFDILYPDNLPNKDNLTVYSNDYSTGISAIYEAFKRNYDQILLAGFEFSNNDKYKSDFEKLLDYESTLQSKLLSIDNPEINEMILNYGDINNIKPSKIKTLDDKNKLDDKLQKENRIVILQYREQKIANAPEELAKAINKFHGDQFYSIVSNQISDYADIVTFHNRYIDTEIPSCILYHSEPWMVHTNFHNKNKMVVAQYQASLPEFKDCKPMRNIIDWTQSIYDYEVPSNDKIRVAFSPTKKDKLTYYHNKGYHETVEILSKLKSKYPDKFDYDVIYKAPLEECIERKKKCNIIIDECVTPSYHRSGLEGLALGRFTICSLSNEVEQILKDITNSNIIPFYNVWINRLEVVLENLINNVDIYKIIEIGKNNKSWMEINWHPKDIVDEYINYYKKIYLKWLA